jgi:hypothetical protein
MKVKAGMERDSVIVLVIAFFIPVSFLTSSSGLTPVKGAILTTLSPTEVDLLASEVAAGCCCLVEEVPLMNAKISSFKTLPSLPVAGTLAISIPCFLAIWRTAGVASALLLDSSTFASSFVLPTF